jgi:hypothetical protein
MSINMPILGVDIVLLTLYSEESEEQESAGHLHKEAEGTPHCRSMWSTGEYYEHKQESRYK